MVWSFPEAIFTETHRFGESLLYHKYNIIPVNTISYIDFPGENFRIQDLLTFLLELEG